MEFELAKVLGEVVKEHGAPICALIVISVLYIRLQNTARSDRLACSEDIRMLNERIDEMHTRQEDTIQELRKGHDTDINALLALHHQQQKDWQASIKDVTDKIMSYLEARTK